MFSGGRDLNQLKLSIEVFNLSEKIFRQENRIVAVDADQSRQKGRKAAIVCRLCQVSSSDKAH